MFVNSYQNGYYTQVWDSKVNPDKNPFYKQLVRKVPSSLKNFYDKEVKSFIFQLEGNQKLFFPQDDKLLELSLHQRYIVLQILIPLGANWSVELGITDLNNNKKRINITTAQGKQQLKYFSFRYPLENGTIEKGTWMFLAIDIYSFCNAFKNTVFRSLDSLVICSSCKIRRLFTMKEWTQFEIPKNYWLPLSIPQILQLIQFKESKQNHSQTNLLLNSSLQYSKMIESKIQIYPSQLRNSQKSSPLQQNIKGLIKLPEVNNRNKEPTPIKSSKLSQKIHLAKNQLNNVAKSQLTNGILGRSNHSLTKADKIIEKSKIRLNSLQQKQDKILQRLKSEDNRFSEKLSMKQKQKSKQIKKQNLFKSDLFKSQFSGVDSKISKFSGNHSPKIIKVKKNFEQDNIFKESYSSSYSRGTEQEMTKQKKNHPKLLQQQALKSSQLKNNNEFDSSYNESINQNMSKEFFKRRIKQSKSSMKKLQHKQREEIIEEDVWTEEDEQQIRKSQTPIEEMIQSQQNGSIIAQTIITRQNNQEIITKQQLNTLKSTNQLQLIYDQMIGCYYHPQTNTYYQIKK